MKLYHKLNIALVFTALLSAGLLSYIFFQFQKGSFLREARERSDLLDQGVNSILTEAKLARDPLMLLDYLANLYTTHPEINLIEARTSAGWSTVKPRSGGEKRLRSEEGPPREFAVGEYSTRLYISNRYLADERRNMMLALSRRLGYSLAVAVGLSSAIALLLSFNLTRRLRTLSAEAGILGEGRFGRQLTVAGSDEISQLADNFNAMSRKLLELEAMKKDFIASVTHELRSPLGAIESHVSMLLRTPRAKAEADSLERIRGNAARLANFVTTLLDLSKIERGKMDLHLTQADPCAITLDIVDFFASKAEERSILLERNIAEGRDMRLDRELLGHVITNLLSNAIKFTPTGGKISVATILDQSGFRLEVSDTGPGVPAQEQPRLFTVFAQGSQAAKGTGLGLALSKSIVALHGGEIGYIPRAGGGSTFWFTIPVITL